MKEGVPAIPDYYDYSSKSIKSGKSAKSGKAKWKSIKFSATAEKKLVSGDPGSTVPDSGSTMALLGLGFVAMFFALKRVRK